jgi:16S rRNA (uracil1498-N3)-methyltransferase
MEAARFYCEVLTGPVAELAGSEAHHLADVRRVSVGSEVELFDGRGKLARATIRTIGRGKVELELGEVETLERRTTGRIVIAPSIAKGDRFDRLVEKCTELGADRVTPVVFERTAKLAKSPAAVERWRRIAISACKQSRRVFVPEIDGPMSIAEATETLRRDYPEARYLYGGFMADATAVAEVKFGRADVVALVGPEGGLTAGERAALKEAGFRGVRLTQTVLRVETAAVAFAAILAAQRDATAESE